jgi:hypothetical protein
MEGLSLDKLARRRRGGKQQGLTSFFFLSFVAREKDNGSERASLCSLVSDPLTWLLSFHVINYAPQDHHF